MMRPISSKGDHLAKMRQRVVEAQESHQARWEASMTRQLEELRLGLMQEQLALLAQRCGGAAESNGIRLAYWGSPVLVAWPEISVVHHQTNQVGSLFDNLVLINYLRCSDGTPLADRWLSFRELPGGAFYHQAFQGYSGDHLAKAFASQPEEFHLAAKALNGIRLSGLGNYAYAFQILPRLRLAALFWPGDDEFASRGSILFDAASLHYMVLDGLAILGARLVGKLEKLIQR
jgi:hypothetical protein